MSTFSGHVDPAHMLEQNISPLTPAAASSTSGVSWGAVIGGAFVAASFYLILLALGAGLGLSSVSPWSNAGISSSEFGAAAIIWLIAIEIIASGLGGYLTGRLRTKWALIHTDEVYFRDTANGFLAWAVALVLTVTFLASTATSMLNGSARREAPSQTGASSSAVADPSAYFVDSLFRSNTITSVNKDANVEAEAGRIFVRALRPDGISAADQTYLGQLVAARTGLSQADADRRVTDVMASARQAAENARKIAAHFLLWTFLTLIIGAFSASFAATIGGRQRDHVKFA